VVRPRCRAELALLVNRADKHHIAGKFLPRGLDRGLTVEAHSHDERISGFLLALEDIDQQRRASSRQNGRNERDEQDRNIAAARRRTPVAGGRRGALAIGSPS
jgi:FAD/FMN-containing dehydrogenase